MTRCERSKPFAGNKSPSEQPRYKRKIRAWERQFRAVIPDASKIHSAAAARGGLLPVNAWLIQITVITVQTVHKTIKPIIPNTKNHAPTGWAVKAFPMAKEKCLPGHVCGAALLNLKSGTVITKPSSTTICKMTDF